MSTSLFGAGASLSVNASGTLIPQVFTATAGQSVFTLTAFSYAAGTNSLLVWINGVKQVVGVDVIESTTSSFSLVEPCQLGDVVDTIGFPLANIDYDAASLRAQIASTASASDGAGMIGFLQAGTGAVPRTLQARLRERVSIKDFGAVCDAVTDDTAAVQLAVNYCLSFAQPKTMVVPGRTRLASSVNVDRLVNTTTAEFLILGEGDGAGFITLGNVTMFDSTIAVVADPKSEFVTFENILFETNASANLSYVMSQKFLRIKFINCMFQRIRCVTASIYVQTWHFLGCGIRNLTGFFMTCQGLYDVDFDICNIENSGRLVDCIDPASVRGALGLRIRGGVIEGLSDTMLNLRGAQALNITGVHMEANFSPWVNVNNVGAMTNSTIVLDGNVCVCNNASDVVMYYGATTKVVSRGNTVFTGRLHDNTVQVVDLTTEDVALAGGSVHDTAGNAYTTVNGVTRVGTTNKAWSDNTNQISKDTSGNFGFSIAAQSSTRMLVLGKDQSNTAWTGKWLDSAGNVIMELRNDRVVSIPALGNYVNDAAAAAGGIPIGGLYRTVNAVQVRVV